MKRNGIWVIVVLILLVAFYFFTNMQCKKNEIEKQAAIEAAIAHVLDSVESRRTLQSPPERTHIVYVEKEVPKVVPPKKDKPDASKNENTFIDERDGQQYSFIKVNDLLWMAQNLNYETDGSFCYDNIAANCDELGGLYNWSSANTSCPEGWHLPNDDEWASLFKYYGGVNVAGRALKEGGDSGFNALMAGYRDHENFYGKKDESAYFWSSTEQNENYASFRGMYHNTNNIGPYTYTKTDAFSVRCVKKVE